MEPRFREKGIERQLIALREERFEGAVAVLDILGFDSRTDADDLDKVRENVVGPLLKATMDAYNIVLHDLSFFIEDPSLRFVYFADTIVLYLPLKSGTMLSMPDRVVESMVFACGLIMASSMWMNLPLRGAIAYGKCLLCRDPLYLAGPTFA